jgi:hypothetical protein
MTLRRRQSRKSPTTIITPITVIITTTIIATAIIIDTTTIIVTIGIITAATQRLRRFSAPLSAAY